MAPRNSGLLGPRFDWMQATVRDDVDVIAGSLAGSLDAVIEDGRGLNGYRASRVLKRQDETLARVLFGGNGNPHLITTGAAADEVVPLLRGSWAGAHEVTRMDSAQDFDDVAGFDRLRGIMLAIAGSANLSVTEMQSTKNGVLSRTVYLGSPSSRVRVRLYEKGCMEHQEGRTDVARHWVRMEAQVRPTGRDARSVAGSLDAQQAWGMSAWTRDLAREAMGADVERVTMRQKREPDYARAMEAMRRQYAGVLARAIDVEGSWDDVGRLLGVLQ